jgi:uncharacterized repeat protein (TIGR03806 family)
VLFTPEEPIVNTPVKIIVLLTSSLMLIVLSACSKPSDPVVPEAAPSVESPAPAHTPGEDDGAFEELFADAIVVSDEEPPNQMPVPAASGAVEVTVDFAARPPKYLSEYGLFKDLGQQIPNDGVLPYELNNAHFSDGAQVRRFIWMPSGTSAQYDAAARFVFPVGTLLLQTFSYPREDGAGERLIESRLSLKQEDTWTQTAYRWNEEGTNARKAVAGGIVEIPDAAGGTEEDPAMYVILNMNDCKRCHENQGRTYPLGLTARNLNRALDYGAVSANQIAHWAALGILDGAPDGQEEYPDAVQWDHPESGSVEARARAWLDVNCAHCHNPLGAGSVSGLDLSEMQKDPIKIGIYKPPVAAGHGSEGHRFSIDPGSPETSFLVRRLMSIDPSVMMPPLGRMTAAEAPAALIREWISQMHFDEAEAEAMKAQQQEAFEQLQGQT